MPELPDVEIYRERLAALAGGAPIEGFRVLSPSLLQTWDPPIASVPGRRIAGFRRIGKRIVWELEGDLFLVFHLMIAGRFHLRKAGAAAPRKNTLAVIDLPAGRLLLTEASPKKRAMLHLVQGESSLAAFDPGGLEPLDSDPATFAAALRRENHTLKRALTDPRLFSGIGNAYSDEILHRARLRPLQLTKRLSDEAAAALHRATVTLLVEWLDRLRRETGDRFPEKVTAFRPEMAVHGRFGQPCPDCGTPVQRIVYADNECDYCSRCQTGGKLLADRGLSRLLRQDWPKTLEEMEERRAGAVRPAVEPPRRSGGPGRGGR